MSAESVARAGVLAALARRGSYASDVRLWCNILADTAVTVKAGEDGVAVGWTYPHRDLREVVAWTVESPAHGVKVLSERGLWPWTPGDANAPRWLCEECQGTGGRRYPGTVETPDEWEWCDACGREDLDATGGVTADGTTADPPSLAALVTVALRGPETLRGVAELARETERRLRPWGVQPIVERVTGDDGHVVDREVPRQIVWRVGPRRTVTSATGTTFEAETPDGWPSVVNSARDSGTTWMWHYDNARRSGIRDVRAWWIAHDASWPADAPPCPYAPVVELLRMGVALDAITDNALVLAVEAL